ncbi:MAG: HpcH/HpaI aldolase/citrate lyase family protein [Thiolinea sp.]
MKTPHNPFKRALQTGQQQYGFWLGLCNPLSAELLAHTGYDWLLIDGEHAPNDLRTVLAQLQAIAGTPAHPVVRLVDGNPATIKQYLDIGAQSLLIPMVETAQQAEALARAVTYPPHGMRGVGTALARAAHWNLANDYFAAVDEELCLLIQVESVTALENLDAILQVERVDGVFIGPADLAATMGHLGNPAHPDVKAAVETAIRKIRAAGKAAGTLATHKTIARHYESVGVQFVALGVDTLVLAQAAQRILGEHGADTATDTASAQPQGNGAY